MPGVKSKATLMLIAAQIKELNEFVLEPLTADRGVQFLSLVVDLAYSYKNERRVVTLRSIQKLLNDNLTTETFCERIATILELQYRPPLVNFIKVILKDLRVKFYTGQACLRGIKKPPGCAVGVLPQPKPQQFPKPISEDYRGADAVVVTRPLRHRLPPEALAALQAKTATMPPPQQSLTTGARRSTKQPVNFAVNITINSSLEVASMALVDTTNGRIIENIPISKPKPPLAATGSSTTQTENSAQYPMQMGYNSYSQNITAPTNWPSMPIIQDDSNPTDLLINNKDLKY